MERNVSLEEISDGKLYGLNDMVKAECGDCKGCSACCTGMGDSIILDPLDIYKLRQNMAVTFEDLLTDKIVLHVVDGVILPNLLMSGKGNTCAFLNQEGRCSIHAFRPGICRLFPLGRYYEGHSFQYFLQIHECKNEKRTKVKVKKWIDTPDIRKNESFIIEWHYFLKEMQERYQKETDDTLIRQWNLYVLQNFYVKDYDDTTDFYEQFAIRIKQAKRDLGFMA